eukprot:1835807-Pyramimonas_sp.AAC.3
MFTIERSCFDLSRVAKSDPLACHVGGDRYFDSTRDAAKPADGAEATLSISSRVKPTRSPQVPHGVPDRVHVFFLLTHDLKRWSPGTVRVLYFSEPARV